ncbi:MAG: hypothetical protein ACM3JG_17320 [Thiohalocapsa sp.]
MQIQRIAMSAAFVAALVGAPLSAARAQYYAPPPCAFPLFWPVCIAGAIVGTAATVVSAPFRAAAAPAYYGYPGAYPQPGPYPQPWPPQPTPPYGPAGYPPPYPYGR